jgi:hypothetical protein
MTIPTTPAAKPNPPIQTPVGAAPALLELVVLVPPLPPAPFAIVWLPLPLPVPPVPVPPPADPVPGVFVANVALPVICPAP